jgi:hypothetical protein
MLSSDVKKRAFGPQMNANKKKAMKSFYLRFLRSFAEKYL